MRQGSASEKDADVGGDSKSLPWEQEGKNLREVVFEEPAEPAEPAEPEDAKDSE